MSRKIYYWKLRESELQLGERTLIMGILNITPDSFSDGGRYLDPDLAYARALELEEQGADIIDIGAESTKPGSRRISADEEWQRLVPVLKRLRGKINVPLSIDTYKAEIAERAMEYGVQIINDPTGLTFDPEIVKAAANANAGLILSHMRGTPETWAKLPPMQDPAGAVVRDLDATVNRARRGGVDKARIVIDPGLGFGKRKEQNSELIANLRQFVQLDCPILIGPSRKHFLAQETETGTMFATAGAVTACILYGAHMVRVHDVKEMLPVVRLADEIAAMPDIAARHAEAAAERAAESKAARASRQGSPMHIEEPKRRPMRPPLARPVVAVVPTAESATSETPETALHEAAASVTSEASASASAISASATPDSATSDSATPLAAPAQSHEQIAADAQPASGAPAEAEAPGEKILRPAAAAKPYVRREPRENARDGAREDRPYSREQRGPSDRSGDRYGDRSGERTGWGPPVRRDSDSGPRKPYSRPFAARSDSRDDRPARPPRDGDFQGGDRPPRKSFGPPRSGAPRSGPPRSGPPRSGPPRSADGKFAPRRFDDRGGPPRRSDGDRPAGRPYPPRRFDDRQDDRPARPPRGGDFEGGDRPPRKSFGAPRSGPPRSGPPRDGARPPFRRDGDAPRGDRPPRTDRPPSGKSFDRPGGDKPAYGKPGGFKPGGFKPGGFKSGGGKPFGGKPGGPPRPFRKRP